MEPFADIANKLLLVLEKTKESLIKDLEKQYAGVRKAAEDFEKKIDTSSGPSSHFFTDINGGLSAGYKVIDAVFAQIGFDISHCTSVNQLSDLISHTLALLDKLTDSIKPLTEAKDVKSMDWSALGESAMGCFKDIKELISGYEKVKTDEIFNELKDAGIAFADDFDVKDFIKKLVEHILIALLRSGQDVFADEIRYIRMQANAVYNEAKTIKEQVEAALNDIDAGIQEEADVAKVLAETLFNETANQLEDVYNRLSAKARSSLNQIANDLSNSVDKSLYEQVADGLSKAYAILDFLGIIGEKRVELKLPKGFISGLKTAQSKVGSALSSTLSTVTTGTSTALNEMNSGLEAGKGLTKKAADDVSEAIGNNLKLTGELVGASAYGLTALQQQLEFIGSGISTATAAAAKAGKMVDEAVTQGIDALASFSYPLTITTFKWGRIERMFTSPVSYFKSLYPVDTLEDAKNLIAKVLEIARLFNPDIPDFRSIRNILESLLQRLSEKFLSLAVDARKTFWEAVKPMMITIRKVLDLLREIYDELVKEVTSLVSALKKKLTEEGSAFVQEVYSEVEALYDTVKTVAKDLPSVPKPIEKMYDQILAPAIRDAVAKSDAPDPQALVTNMASDAKTQLQGWAAGVYSNLYGFFSPTLWKNRLDTVLDQLEYTFKGDVGAVQGLLSGAMQTSFSGEWGKKLSDTFSELDVTQYIDILSSALDDVSVPNPALYYDGFRQCIGKIVDDAKLKLNEYGVDDVEQFGKDLAAAVWNRIVNQVFMPLIRKIKARLLALVREAVREILQRILDAVRDVQNSMNGIPAQVSEVADNLIDALPTLRELEDFKKSVDDKKEAQAAQKGLKMATDALSVFIPVGDGWIQWIYKIAERAIEFSTSDMGYDKILALAMGLYSDLPAELKDYVEDILPSIPENDFTDFVKSCDYKADLDNDFISVTVVEVDSKKDTPKNKKSKVNFEASALLQLCMFAIDKPVKEDAQEDGSGEEQGDSQDKEQETETVLYCIVVIKAGTTLSFQIGKNHRMSLSVQGGTGSPNPGTDVKKETLEKLANGCGLEIKKDWEVNGLFNLEALQAMFLMTFERIEEQGQPNPWHVFDTKYLSLDIGNYPQVFYLGFDKARPALKEYGLKEGKAADGNTFQVGYFGAIKEAAFKLKLQDVAFIKEVIKDDVVLNLDTYLMYDLQNGFDFGGGVSLHLDFDMNHKKLGPVTIDSFSVDAGVPQGEKGKLALAVGTTFQVNFADALVVAIEDLGIGFKLNYLDEKGDFGDLDLDASLQYPTGIGITVDATAVKGAGIISIDRDTGEFFGFLSLDILKKIGVGGFLLCDPGTAKGHHFSMVVLLSANFHPGIPLGMGFSLTAIGGTLGLNRQISRDAIQNGVRAGSLDQVFFVGNIEEQKDHLAEIKSNIIAYFPDKKGQFFFGVLGQISFEPIVKCDFGLLLQLPSPTEVIIVGALRVNAAEGIVKINVYFAGGINFAEGMWFDASIVNSQIVGIAISGDMAFRLNWGGQKGFLLSIGGFHPAYKPEEGLHVGKMNRLAMKLDYDILKISFETYMAVTSNTFQIGARFDLKVGWKQFGLVGYAGFDALFQFDPFLFMFGVCAGVSVIVAGATVLSIALSMDVQGPAPWKVAGKAKFKFLLIPVEVEFSKTWGKDTPELPSKTVEVFPLLLEQWKDEHNWSVDNTDLTGRTAVLLFNSPSEDGEEDAKKKEMKVLVIQPDGSLTFNQSAVPLRTEETLERMEICNDAVPADYDSLRIETVNGAGVGAFGNEENDFAPTLFKSMTIQEKLASPSYVKYNSGFTLNEKDKLESFGESKTMTRTVNYKYRPFTQKSGTDNNGLQHGNINEMTPYGTIESDELLRKVKLSNYGKTVVGNILDGLMESRQDTHDLTVQPRLRTRSMAASATSASVNTVQSNFNLDLKDKPGTDLFDGHSHDFDLGHSQDWDLDHFQFENLDNPEKDPHKQPDEGLETEPLEPTGHGEITNHTRRVQKEPLANDRRDRVSFDRYLAVLDRKTTK